MQPWNDWYHCTIHTYGSWLRGDPRGWRARHHREHVVGDYKNPPPKGKYDALFEYSKSLMKRDPVKIERELRQFVLDALIDKLLENQVPVAAASLDGIHGHILAQCHDLNPRHWIGLAKKNASHLVRQLNLLPPGGLWGRRSHPEPITGPPHYDNSVDYIHKHARKGAVLYVPEQIITAETAVVRLPGNPRGEAYAKL
jgi:hypothetical protein